MYNESLIPELIEYPVIAPAGVSLKFFSQRLLPRRL